MKVCLVYLRVIKKSDPAYPEPKNYDESTRTFIETYTRFKPLIDHELLVVNCGAYPPDGLFNQIAQEQVTAITGGWDNGTYQEVNPILLHFDLVMVMNTHVHFWRHGWLEPFINAAQTYGPGLYGPSGSFEHNPHLRTPCLCYHPMILAKYPMRVDTRGDCCLFESGPDNFSIWTERRGFPVRMVTASGECLSRPDWRKPDNIFRRGTQENILVLDRHVDVWNAASPKERLALARAADGQ